MAKKRILNFRIEISKGDIIDIEEAIIESLSETFDAAIYNRSSSALEYEARKALWSAAGGKAKFKTLVKQLVEESLKKFEAIVWDMDSWYGNVYDNFFFRSDVLGVLVDKAVSQLPMFDEVYEKIVKQNEKTQEQKNVEKHKQFLKLAAELGYEIREE